MTSRIVGISDETVQLSCINYKMQLFGRSDALMTWYVKSLTLFQEGMVYLNM